MPEKLNSQKESSGSGLNKPLAFLALRSQSFWDSDVTGARPIWARIELVGFSPTPIWTTFRCHVYARFTNRAGYQFPGGLICTWE
jgi:hypothetical protein